ncbi:putative PurR-regulated permease PerM [Arcanobacterium wilhelmae]|uniref:PurR-regulated permease PerM n=1 Tax=Arcanobacterium wilhelmae TaxID=1803177 RepID=A0ABT9ND85_9ACTO|nr:AI-2E family transporter [Arcanobacterium wilhelmae]MDP9801686.1 putative PurR-regulated permease PerM [Arcanobacterium wilhelmae]WFN91007.1 AI-2E family transporter [Arcanobacterium wilhelmae]
MLNNNSSEPKVPVTLERSAAWSWRLIVTTVALLAAGWAMLQLSSIVVALMVSLLLAVILEPVASFLRNRWHWPRSLASVTALLGLVIIVSLLLIGAGTSIFQGFADLSSQINAGIDSIVAWLHQQFPQFDQEISNAWQQVQDYAKSNSSTIAGGVASVGSGLLSLATGTVLVLFTLFFFLKDGRRMWHWVVRLFPAENRTAVNESGIRAWITVASYVRVQAIVAFVDALGIALVAFILKTPITLAFPIGVLVFLFSFIPIVGAFVSGFVATMVVLVNTGSPWMALAMFVGVLVVQQVEGNVLQPVLQGNALNMHPLAIVMVIAGGSALFGLYGALFSVPIAAAVNTVALYLRGHDIYPYLTSDENRPGGPFKPFDYYTKLYWEDFAQNVAQTESPKSRFVTGESGTKESIERDEEATASNE